MSDVTDKELRDEKQKLLHRMGRAAVQAFQEEVRRSSWNSPPTDLIESFRYEILDDDAIRVVSDHPAAEYLNKGVKPHQMIYLTKAKKPIPIITDSGEVIFRTPTFESMRDGSWRHPGISGKHFLERGEDKAKERMQDEIRETYKELLRKALKG